MGYGTFMRRVSTHELHDTIFPLPMPSLVAAKMLYMLGYRIDVVYLDSAHEMGETLIELHLFYQLLRPGGMMLGDDCDWVAVASSLRLFEQCDHVQVVRFGHNQWY